MKTERSKTIPITLGISKGGDGGVKTGVEADGELRQKLFERDNFTCRGCGFKSAKYQDIHHINGVRTDLRPENLATICIYCQQCFTLDKVPAMRSGVLVWLPEIPQTTLHHIIRAIFVARISQGPVADAARRALEVLLMRREDARARLGTDDPYILATVLRDYITDKTYDARETKLDGIRLCPLDRRVIKEADLEFNQFPQILAYWRSKDGPFGSLVPKQWVGLYKGALQTVSGIKTPSSNISSDQAAG